MQNTTFFNDIKHHELRKDEIIYARISRNDTLENVIQVVTECINDLCSNLNLTIIMSKSKQKNNVFFNPDNHLYPKVASIEITSKCNLRCMHCYGEFDNQNSSEMNLQKIYHLLNDLSDMGVEIIELTGGDITMHKELYEILEFALNLKFKKIGLLTNGVALSENVIHLIIKNKKTIYMQIDIHSLKDGYIRWFTKTKIDIQKLQTTIEYLSNNGVLIRIATIFTKRNINEFNDIGRYVAGLHQKWGISPVEPLGRAVIEADANDLYLDIDRANLLNEYIQKFSSDYPNVIFYIPEERIKHSCNCGTLSNHVAIDSNGNIKLCTMDNLNYCSSSIGNVFDIPIKSIYDENSSLIFAIANQKVPTEETAECQECEYKFSCMRCLLRTLKNIKNSNFKCKWLHDNLTPELKDKFYQNISY